MEEQNLLVDVVRPDKACMASGVDRRERKKDMERDVTRKPGVGREQIMAREGGMGRLPAKAPLANPYVPYQLENPPKYEAKMGLTRGTLFPGLDLPFMGMVSSREHMGPEAELRALAFSIQELALYLDTHRDDREALELYRSYQALFQEGEKKYVQEFGPLNHMQPGSGDRYQWLDDPWPWEYPGRD